MSNSRDTKVLIEVTWTHRSIPENQKHILPSIPQTSGAPVCVIGLVEGIMYRKVISPVDDISAVFSETVR